MLFSEVWICRISVMAFFYVTEHEMKNCATFDRRTWMQLHGGVLVEVPQSVYLRVQMFGLDVYFQPFQAT